MDKAVVDGGKTIQDAVDVLRQVLRHHQADHLLVMGDQHEGSGLEGDAAAAGEEWGTEATAVPPPAHQPPETLSYDATLVSDIHLIGRKQQPPPSHLQRSAVYVIR